MTRSIHSWDKGFNSSHRRPRPSSNWTKMAKLVSQLNAKCRSLRCVLIVKRIKRMQSWNQTSNKLQKILWRVAPTESNKKLSQKSYRMKTRHRSQGSNATRPISKFPTSLRKKMAPSVHVNQVWPMECQRCYLWRKFHQTLNKEAHLRRPANAKRNLAKQAR